MKREKTEWIKLEYEELLEAMAEYINKKENTTYTKEDFSRARPFVLNIELLNK